MKKIFKTSILVLSGLFVVSSIMAQDQEEQTRSIKKEVKVTIDEDSDQPVYSVETTTTENGEKKVVKKTYNSLEEMKADSSIDAFKKSEDGTITMKIGDKGSGVMVFKSEDGETIDIEVDEMSEDLEWVQAGEDGDSNTLTKSYKVKVIKDGEEADHEIHEHKNMFVIKDEDGNISMNHGDSENVMVWVDDSGNKTVKRTFHTKVEKANFSEASIQPLAAGDEAFSAFNLSTMPALELKSINYYPNPNEGEFTLAFSGSKKPVIVRILDNKGNLKVEESIEEFNGTFNQVMNVKHLDKGNYLLQIFQQDKVLNRKLVLE